VDSLPFILLVALFVAAAAAVWVAGIHLSKATEVLDARLRLGSALGGLIVLAVATNLPEIAITVSAVVSGNLELIFRPQRRIIGMGVDSFVVLVLHALGTAGLFAVSG